MSIVELTDIWKTYKMGQVDVHALRGISLSIEQGEMVAIMGPSGSGKSTMLNLLGCLDRPTLGRYLLAGRDVSELDDDELSEVRAGRLGFIFQSYNLIPQLNVIENIEVPLYYQGLSETESFERAAELAAEVGLGDRANHLPTELSGGQQQRVAIARALANRPAIVLADEPTGNLDSHTGAEILELLSSLNKEGVTLVLVTHDPAVGAICHRVIDMMDGHLTEQNTAESGAK